jgi:hypothetical protein
VEEADAGETSFAEADAERAERGQQPLRRSEVRQGGTIPEDGRSAVTRVDRDVGKRRTPAVSSSVSL